KKEKYMTIFKTGVYMLLINGFAVTIIALILYPVITEYIFTDSRLYLAFLLFFPSVILITVFSAFRGYFQGSHQSSQIGKSQTVEQIVRVVAGISIVYFLLQRDYPLAVLIAGLSVATFFAEFAGGAYLWRRFAKENKNVKNKGNFSPSIAKEFIKIGSPLTISRIVTTLAISCQAILIPKALVLSGYSLSEAASLYGYFSGVALTVLHLPAIVTSAITTPLVPAIAEAKQKNDIPILHKRIRDSIVFTNYTAVPMLAFIFYFATPICDILFSAQEAGSMLSLFCLGGILLYMQQPIVAVLQGLNHFKELLFCLILGDGAYILLLALCYLKGDFTIEQGIIAFIINDAILLTSYIVLLKRKTKVKMKLIRNTFFPLCYSLAGLCGTYIIEQRLNLTSITVPEIIGFGAVFISIYFMGMLIFDRKNLISFNHLGKRYRQSHRSL
ncbi:MAG: oligosaccharide flippase family protein, partial [Bacillota bacterium]|nr:oligosaccharide flippase family protein [Bacillota bacterium]